MTDAAAYYRAVGRAENPEAAAIRAKNRETMHDLLRREVAARAGAPAHTREAKTPGLLTRVLDRARALL